MVVKTITVTKDAYAALKALKEPRESFSETILRVAKRKPLSAFFGVLGKESGERLEKAVLEMRKRRNEAHRARMKEIIRAFKER
jgi:predicted CopG family antitoxin